MLPAFGAPPGRLTLSLDLSAIQDADAVALALQELYGVPIGADVGVIHPTAVWGIPGGDGYVTININEDSPKSLHDRFVLNSARARADAILTTGKILREESALEPGLIGSASETAPILAWRGEILGKPEAPLAMVLTSGRGLDLSHPFFQNPGTIVFTNHTTAEQIMMEALERSVDVVSHPHPSVTTALEYLREEAGCGTVSIEAGPSTSRTLYHPDVIVDELLLSVFHGSSLPRSVRGGDFLSPVEIEGLFLNRSPTFEVRESSGRWSFQRWTRP